MPEERSGGGAMDTRCGPRPRVSIGMPVYNGESFLGEAIDSLLEQTFGDFELVISDNASTDRTQEICRGYVAQDPRVRYFRNPVNVGLARNFNRVVQLSSAEYFKFADADDVCGPDLLAQCVAVLDRSPSVVLCYGKTVIIDERGQFLRRYEDRLDLRSPSPVERFRQVLRRSGLVNVMQGVMRSGALRKTSLLGNYLAHDQVLVAELALQGQFCEIPQELFFRRMHADSFTATTSSEKQRQVLDPGRKGTISLDLWEYYIHLAGAALRAPVTWAERARLAEITCRGAYWEKKILLKELSAALREQVRRVVPI